MEKQPRPIIQTIKGDFAPKALNPTMVGFLKTILKDIKTMICLGNNKLVYIANNKIIRVAMDILFLMEVESVETYDSSSYGKTRKQRLINKRNLVVRILLENVDAQELPSNEIGYAKKDFKTKFFTIGRPTMESDEQVFNAMKCLNKLEARLIGIRDDMRASGLSGNTMDIEQLEMAIRESSQNYESVEKRFLSARTELLDRKGKKVMK